jgi:hypothetical protein
MPKLYGGAYVLAHPAVAAVSDRPRRSEIDATIYVPPYKANKGCHLEPLHPGLSPALFAPAEKWAGAAKARTDGSTAEPALCLSNGQKRGTRAARL